MSAKKSEISLNGDITCMRQREEPVLVSVTHSKSFSRSSLADVCAFWDFSHFLLFITSCEGKKINEMIFYFFSLSRSDHSGFDLSYIFLLLFADIELPFCYSCEIFITLHSSFEKFLLVRWREFLLTFPLRAHGKSSGNIFNNPVLSALFFYTLYTFQKCSI